MISLSEWWATLVSKFTNDFIVEDRWRYIWDGLGVTLIVTICSVIIGITIGFIVAVIRSTHDKTGKLKIGNGICRVYLTVIRGTPVVVQLLIIYFVIFASSNAKTLIAIITFGINSGAYVAEIFRSGIMSIDNGQFEAGRSLGFNYTQTMWHIIMPQADRPAEGNSDRRLYCSGGSHQRRRYYPRAHIRCVFTAHCCRTDISHFGIHTLARCDRTGKEAEPQ
jgi:His/Glu/Gln/Arg/opine family amino acid ABC transporter permease subunit